MLDERADSRVGWDSRVHEAASRRSCTFGVATIDAPVAIVIDAIRARDLGRSACLTARIELAIRVVAVDARIAVFVESAVTDFDGQAQEAEQTVSAIGVVAIEGSIAVIVSSVAACFGHTAGTARRIPEAIGVATVDQTIAVGIDSASADLEWKTEPTERIVRAIGIVAIERTITIVVAPISADFGGRAHHARRVTRTVGVHAVDDAITVIIDSVDARLERAARALGRSTTVRVRTVASPIAIFVSATGANLAFWDAEPTDGIGGTVVVVAIEPSIAIFVDHSRANLGKAHDASRITRAAERITAIGESIAVVIAAVIANLGARHAAHRARQTVGVGAVEAPVTVIIYAIVADLGHARSHAGIGVVAIPATACARRHAIAVLIAWGVDAGARGFVACVRRALTPIIASDSWATHACTADALLESVAEEAIIAIARRTADAHGAAEHRITHRAWRAER